MAIKSSSGFIIEKPKSITQQASDSGIGTPSSPFGGNAVSGATSKQLDMVGTPAQQANAAAVRRDLQKQQQEKPQSDDTLEKHLRYTTDPSAVSTTESPAQQLANLGPVKSQINALVEQKMSMLAQTDLTMADLTVSDAMISALDPSIQQDARDALEAWKVDPSEENIQAFANIVGQSQLNNMGQWFGTQQEVMSSLVDMGGPVTLQQLDFSGTGISLDDLAGVLGEDVATVSGYTLDDLDMAIDAYEAKNLQQVESIKAQLNDPMLPPQVRQQLLDQLSQLNRAGVAALEAEIDQLEENISQANVIEIGGVKMSVADAFSDEGITQTIKNAILDPSYLDDLKNIPGTEQLAQWIEDNKTAFATLLGDFESDASDFLDVNKKYDKLKTTFGEDGTDLIKYLLGIDLPRSVTSTQFSSIMADIKKNKTWKFLLDFADEDIVARAKTDKQFLDSIIEKTNKGWSPEEILESFEIEEKIASGEITLPEESSGAVTINEDGTVTVNNTAELEEISQAIDVMEGLDDDVYSLYKEKGISLSDANRINNSENKTKIILDIYDWYKKQADFSDVMSKATKDPDELFKYLFGHSNIHEWDLTWAMKQDHEHADLIAELFDKNKDGKITSDEMAVENVGENLKEYMNLDVILSNVISSEGQWDSTRPAIGLGENVYAIAQRDKMQETKNSLVADLQLEAADIQGESEEIMNDMKLYDVSIDDYIQNAYKIRNLDIYKKKYQAALDAAEKAKNYKIDVDKYTGEQYQSMLDEIAEMEEKALRLEAIANSWKERVDNTTSDIQTVFPNVNIDKLEYNRDTVTKLANNRHDIKQITKNIGKIEENWTEIENIDLAEFDYRDIDKWDIMDGVDIDEGSGFGLTSTTDMVDTGKGRMVKTKGKKRSLGQINLSDIF